MKTIYGVTIDGRPVMFFETQNEAAKYKEMVFGKLVNAKIVELPFSPSESKPDKSGWITAYRVDDTATPSKWPPDETMLLSNRGVVPFEGGGVPFDVDPDDYWDDEDDEEDYSDS